MATIKQVEVTARLGERFKIESIMEADMFREDQERFLHEIDLRSPVSDNLKGLTPVSFELS